MPQLLSPRAATTEAHAPRACALQQEKPLQREAVALHGRGVPRVATRESPSAAMKTQCKEKS